MNGGEFLEPESMYSIIARRFPIWYFLVSFSVNLCVFPLSVLRLLTFSACCLSIHHFCYVHLVTIVYSKIVQLLLHRVVSIFLCHLLQLVGRIFFRCFGMICFVCIVLPFVDIFLIFLLFPVLSGLFLRVVLLFFPVLPFPFCSYIFQHLSFVSPFWPVFVDFFICVSCRNSYPGFDFSFVFLKRSQFSRKLISVLYKLVHLIRLYYSLIYLSVLDSLYSSPT